MAVQHHKMHKFLEVIAHNRAKEGTLLDQWMIRKRKTAKWVAEHVGVSLRSIKYWRYGQTLPCLVYAFKIDAVTAGQVPPESWLATALGKARWNGVSMEGKQHGTS